MQEPASPIDRTSHPQNERKGHKELGSVRKRRDEEDVQKIMEVISHWRNPFEKADDAVSLSSGSVASNFLKEDLLKVEEKGKTALVSFVQDRHQQCSRVLRDTAKAEVREMWRCQENGEPRGEEFCPPSRQKSFRQAPGHRTESKNQPERTPHSRTRTCALLSGNLASSINAD